MIHYVCRIVIILTITANAVQYAHTSPSARICHLDIRGSGSPGQVSATMHCTNPAVTNGTNITNREHPKLLAAVTAPGMVQLLKPSSINFTGVQLHDPEVEGQANSQGPCQLQWADTTEMCMLYLCWPLSSSSKSGKRAVDVIAFVSIVGVEIGAAMQSAIGPGSSLVPNADLPACVLCLGGNISATIVDSTFSRQKGIMNVCLGGHARVTIADSVFTGVLDSPPIFAGGTSELVLTRSVVAGNKGGSFVRIVDDATAMIDSSVFYNNTGPGASILDFGGRASGTVSRTWFFDNRPGAYSFTIQAYGQGVVNVSQCAIIDNHSSWTGGVHVTQTGVGYIGGGTHFCSNVGPAVGADVASNLYIGDTRAMTSVIDTHAIENPCPPLDGAARTGKHLCAGTGSRMMSRLDSLVQSLRQFDKCALFRQDIRAFVASLMNTELPRRDHLESLMLHLGQLGGVSPVVFSGNPAGAVIVYVKTSVHFTGDCLFVDNSGNQGGALSAQSAAHVKIDKGSTTAFINNTAIRSGGAVHCMGHSKCWLEGQALYIQNNAGTGGAIAVSGASKVHMPGTAWFYSNDAASGGAVHASDSSSVQVVGHVAFMNNSASEGSGGCILVDSSARLQLSGQVLCMLNNTASIDGAAIHVMDSGVLLIDTQDSMCGCNQAGSSGACLSVIGKANLLVDRDTHLHACNNVAGQGGAIALDGGSVASIRGMLELLDNQASQAGGGVCLSGSAVLHMEAGSTLDMRRNTAGQGGALAAVDSSGLVLRNNVTMMASNNAAGLNGGGVYVQHQQNTVAGTGSNNGGLNPTAAHALTIAAVNNNAPLNKDLAITPSNLRLLTRSAIPAYVSRRRLEDGLLPLAVFVGGAGSWPVQGVVLAATYGVGKDMIGGTTISNQSGVANFSNLKLQERAGAYTVTVQAKNQPQLQPVNVTVHIRPCVEGEVCPDNNMTYCEPCPRGSYSFNPSNTSCDACPGAATCAGGKLLVPLEGFWHSAPDSPQVHRCLHAAACWGSRSDLANWQKGIHAMGGTAISPGNTPVVSTYSRLQCSDGHTGPLCAVCLPGYGLERAFACNHCMASATWVALFVLAALLSCGVIRVLAHLTWAENNRSVAAALSPPAQATPSNQSLGSPTLAPVRSAESTSAEAATVSSPVQALSNPSMGSHPSQFSFLSGRNWSSPLGVQPARVTPGDVLKAMVVFIQYCFIIGSMPVEWPVALSACFTALSWLWSSSNGQALSIDCMPPFVQRTSSSQRALARVLFHLLSPAALVLLIMIMECVVRQAKRHLSRLSQSQQQSHFLLTDHLVIIAMVSLFFFYPALVQVIFSMFVCVDVDDPGFVPYGVNGATAGSYWAFDMNQACWEGYHKAWATGVGLLAGLPVLMGVPAAIAWLLQANMARLTSPLFSARYNFLYRCYGEHCVAWGIIELVETVALVAVAVFGRSLGLHYQALLMNCVLAVMLLLLLIFRPYSAQQLQRLRVAGLACLLVASYVVLTFIMPTASTNSILVAATTSNTLVSSPSGASKAVQVWKELAGALIVILGVLYLLACVRELARAVDWVGLKEMLRQYWSAVLHACRL